MNKFNLRRLIIYKRSLRFLFKKLKWKIFGIDNSWLLKCREDYQFGSWRWLALSESRYGGFKMGMASGRNLGGDRMSPFFHGYGEYYEEFLKPFLFCSEERLTLVEIGILNGSGLAIWCDLFPNARVLGFDLDLSNFEKNRSFLESQGAFSKNKPELFEFDQLDLPKAQTILQNVLGDVKVDIAIDDGCHSLESINITFKALKPHLNRSFVYFIEDNFDTYDFLARKNGEYRWSQRGEMVVLRNR
jgi:hypothetical protein